VHDALKDDSGVVVEEGDDRPKLFVPTRHEHGDGNSDSHEFDHKIFSVNTTKQCGTSTEEEKETYRIKSAPELTPLNVLANIPFLSTLLPIAVLRRKTINGFQPNKDFEFATLPSEDIEKARADLQSYLDNKMDFQSSRKNVSATPSSSTSASTSKPAAKSEPDGKCICM